MTRRIHLTERDWEWLWEFTRAGSSASEAARKVYGRTPMSVRVKGYKKKVKLKPILDPIDRKWQQFIVRTPDGHLRIGKHTDQIQREVDAYLRRLRRRMSKGYATRVSEASTVAGAANSPGVGRTVSR